jgi:hypothetical protein
MLAFFCRGPETRFTRIITNESGNGAGVEPLKTACSFHPPEGPTFEGIVFNEDW